MDYITGSSGFLGSHLLKALKGRKVVKIDNDKISSCKLKPFDTFFFFSTYGNLYSHNEDDKILQANVGDIIHVIQEAKRVGFKSFVFTSTSSVNLRIQTMYSRAKRAAEEILLSYMEKYNLPICVVRPFSITGVGDHPEHLIPALIRSCLTGRMINFVPSPTHDFIDVSDVIAGILNLSENRVRGIFELGTGEKYTNLQVLEMVEEATGKEARINVVNSLRSYDNQDWVSINYRARGYGWLPKKSLEQSIAEMVAVAKKVGVLHVERPRKKSH